jgi:hypothetical protein
MFEPAQAGVMSSPKLAASKPIQAAIYEERVTTTKLYRTWPVCDCSCQFQSAVGRGFLAAGISLPSF